MSTKFEAQIGLIKKKTIQLLQPVTKFFVRYGLNPNWFTSLSLMICSIAAYYFATGKLRIGGILLLLGSSFDMIDGAVARASNRVTKFGALYDSTLDRYSEILTFFGIAYYFVAQHQMDSQTSLFIPVMVFLALAGSIMVSYVRARAESLGFECKSGLMQRPERVVVLGFGAVIHQYVLVFSIVLIAVLANYTAIQRLYLVWAEANYKKSERLPPNADHE